MNPEHKHHFNKCVECGKKPDLTYTPLTREITLSCPGQCARLYITCIGLDLAETLWNTANPANVSHATAFSENPEIHEWKHGGEPEPEDPPSRQEIADAMRAMVEMYPDWTDRELAEAGACSRRTIQKIRENLNSEKPDETPLSYQVGGDHYRNLKIQPIELFQKTGLDFELANAMKYVIRYKRKNGIEDLQKAKQYLDFYAARWKPLNDFVNAFFRQFDPKTRFLMEEILFGNFESAKKLIDQLEAEYEEAAQ